MRRIAMIGIAVLFTVGAGWSLASSTKGTDPRLGACAGPQGNVRVAFELAHARDLWDHIPGFLKAPELEVDDPAHVVVYDGPVVMEAHGRPRQDNTPGPMRIDHVVCVAIAGDPTYYTSVDLSVVTP